MYPMLSFLTKRIVFGVFLTAAAGILPLIQAQAAKAQAVNLPIQASVTKNCSITNPVGINFGTYDPIVANASTAVTANGSIDIKCTGKTTVNIALGKGANGDNTTCLDREMNGPVAGYLLPYNLYQDSGLSDPWGCQTGTNTNEITATGKVVTYTVYGQIPAGNDLTDAQLENIGPGAYTDTVEVTFAF